MSGQQGRDRRRQILQLHLPLVVALGVCTAATVIEFGRATEGVARAWAYTLQWPMFGAFAIWMWVRYRREDRSTGPASSGRRNPLSGLTDRWRAQVADAERAADAEEMLDPQLLAWRAHLDELRRQESAPPDDLPRETITYDAATNKIAPTAHNQ